VDITGKTGNDSKPLVFGSINLISTNLVAEIPIGKKINVIGAIRQSFSNVYTTTLYKDLLKNQLGEPQIPRMQNMSELEPEFKFYDFNTKISFNASNTEKFSISMYGGKDYLDNSIEGRNPNYRIETVDINEWRNYGVSFSWLKQWNASYFSNLQIGNSGYSNNYTNSTTVTRREMNENNDSILPKLINNFASEESNNLRDVSVNLRNTYLIDVHNQLDFGFVMKYNDFEFEKNVDEIFTYNRLNNRSFLYSAFIQNKFLPHSKISIKPGIRTNYYSNTQKMNVEPRFSLTYNPVKLLTLKMATGKYFQYLSKVTVDEQYGYNRDFWVLSDDNLHPVLTSVHVIGGAAIQMGDFYLDVEGYYKTMRGLQLYLFISPYLKNTTMKDFFNPQVSEKPVPSIFLTGDGKAKGLDVLLRYEKPFYTSWISYSLSSSVQSFKAINNGADIPAPYDHTHELNFVHIASVNKWNFSVVYLFTSGNPYIDSTYYQKFKISRTYARLPNYHRVDISANYNLKLKKSKITFGASIINLFNYSNYHDIYMREFDFDNTSFTETTLVQAQNFTPNFYISFEF